MGELIFSSERVSRDQKLHHNDTQTLQSCRDILE